MDELTTPVEIARELGHEDKGRRVRRWLRSEFPNHEPHARWELDDEVAERVRRAFTV